MRPSLATREVGFQDGLEILRTDRFAKIPVHACRDTALLIPFSSRARSERSPPGGRH